MREIRKSGSEGGAGQNNVPFLPLSLLKSKSKLLLVLDPVSLPEKGSREFYYGWLAGMSPAFGTRRNTTVRFCFSAPGMDTAKGG